MSNIKIKDAIVKNSVTGDNNEVNITIKQKAGWFLSGFVIPIVAALIAEYIEQGKVSEILNLVTRLFN